MKISIKELEIWTDEKHCLEAVKRNGYALQYVKEQTEAICLEAVKEDGYALQYVTRIFWGLFKGLISGM